MSKWWIGCSGFHYKEWKEVFYPGNIPQTKWFEHYCEHFNSLEINTTFYSFPKPEALRKWHDRSPEDFKFSVKAPRLVTHYKNFMDCANLLGDFYASVYEGFGDKLGCVLFQLPGRIKYSEEMLERILSILDPSFDNVIEFRHFSWWNDIVYKILKKRKIAFSGVSHPDLQNEAIINHSIIYYRFHGVPTLYKSIYEEAFIQSMTDQIKSLGKFKEAYVYFNNTWGTGGFTNAKQMQAHK